MGFILWRIASNGNCKCLAVHEQLDRVRVSLVCVEYRQFSLAFKVEV